MHSHSRIGMTRRGFYVWLKLALAWLIFLSVGTTVNAQNFSITGVAGDTIDAGVACGTANLTKTISVSGITSITDLNVGFLADHTWRGDIRLDLTSPAPGSVTVRLIESDTSGAGAEDDYNIELDDETAETVNTGTNDVDHDTSQPVYQFIAGPNNALSAFDADTTPNGNWTLTICDDLAGFDDGLFLGATLFFQPTTGADLSLNASTATLSPEIGATITLTFDVLNSGPEAAGGVTTQINVPAGMSYVSHSGAGTYDNAAGLWTLPPSIASGSTTTLTIDVFIEPIGPYNLTGEITASDKTDIDSTPNNGSTTEDDDDSITVSPVPSTTPPSLTCPAGDQFTLNWAAPGATNGWNAGSLTNSYTAGGETINFAMTGATNRFIARTFSGSTLQTPVTTTQFANGPDVGEYGVVMNVDYVATSESVLTTIDLGTAGTGIGEVQFQILDVDLGAWTDRIVVTGTLSGTPVLPILTTSGSNTTSGTDTFLGTGGAPTGSTAGNTTVTFLNPVDQITFDYDNASPTANPASQVISVQKLVMCPPIAADLTAEKSVAPAIPGGYMTPGTEVLYTITVSNSAAATADAEAIDMTDTLPDTVRFVSAITTGFTGGAFGSPALPATNTDCLGGACVIHYSGASLPINSTGEVIVTARIK